MVAEDNTSKKPIIEIKDLRQDLGSQRVLKDIDLTIYKNERFGIAGGSGSGKTTLLRSILMLLKPTHGTIRVFNKDISRCREAEASLYQRRWGVMFQHSALFSSLTVLENVMFPLRIHTNFDVALQKKIALLKIAMVGLTKQAALKYPSELSGGMQKRAALARALALDPELLFLDEPTAGLDPKSSETFEKLILHLYDIFDLTLVMVTHDLDALWTMTTRTAFLGQGKILAVDTIENLTRNKHRVIKEYFDTYRGQRMLTSTEANNVGEPKTGE